MGTGRYVCSKPWNSTLGAERDLGDSCIGLHPKNEKPDFPQRGRNSAIPALKPVKVVWGLIAGTFSSPDLYSGNSGQPHLHLDRTNHRRSGHSLASLAAWQGNSGFQSRLPTPQKMQGI